MIIFKEIFNVLRKINSNSILPLILLIIFNGFLEVVGISALIPIITLLVSDLNNPLIEAYKEIFNISSQVDLLNYAIICFLVIFTLKSFFSLFVYFKQGKFIHDVEEKLTYSLFKNEIYHDEDSESGVAEKTKIIIDESNQFSRGVIRSLLSFLSEFIISISLITYLLLQDIQSTMIILIVVSIASFIYISLVGQRLTRLGIGRIDDETTRLTLVKEFLQNRLKFKIEGFPESYSYKFSLVLQSLKKNYVITALLNNMPKIYFEYIFLFSICIVILFAVNINGNYSDIVVSLIIIMAVFMKIVPSVNRMVTSQQNFKYAQKVITLVKDGLNKKANMQKMKLQLKDFKNINIAFNGNEIISNSEFIIDKYKVIGIIGESGSGKSTLIRHILGFHGNSLNSPPYSNVAILEQDSTLISGSIRLNIDPSLNVSDKNIFMLMDAIGLGKLLKETQFNLDTLIGEQGLYLSGGQKQRLLIVKTILSKPEYIILDESTSALDKMTQSFVISLLSKYCKDSKIILITHRIEMLELCDVVYQLENKKIVKKS
tara:strand:+ start:12659 stop:14290 length:1632 start_codon:yes stop_codon:yes gene_type:complete